MTPQAELKYHQLLTEAHVRVCFHYLKSNTRATLILIQIVDFDIWGQNCHKISIKFSKGVLLEMQVHARRFNPCFVKFNPCFMKINPCFLKFNPCLFKSVNPWSDFLSHVNAWSAMAVTGELTLTCSRFNPCFLKFNPCFSKINPCFLKFNPCLFN